MATDKSITILDSILNSIPSIVYLYDLDNETVQFLNQTIYSQLGYDKKESNRISFHDYLDNIHPMDVERYKSYIASVQTGREKKFTSVEYRLKSKNGDWKWYSDSVFFLISEISPKRELIGYATDINSLKKRKRNIYARKFD